MAFKYKSIVSFFLCFANVSVSAYAKEETCRYRQTIAALADGLLTDLDSSDPYIARLYGSDAAYLELRYGKMDDRTIGALMTRIGREEVYGNLSFVYAYFISRFGLERATAILGKRNLSYFDHHPYDLTLIRELTAIGRFDLVIRNLTTGNWSPEILPPQLALALIDLPVSERRRLAAVAEAGKATMLAMGLYASLPTHEDWPGFRKRNFDKTPYKDWLGYAVVFSGYNFDSPPLPDPHNYSNGQLYRQFVQKIVAAGWMESQSSLLLSFAVDHKFQPVYGKRAALTLRRAYDKGELRPESGMEKSWLLTYRAVAQAVGDERQSAQMMQHTFAASRHHVEGNAADILDAMLAAEVIGPWLRGETQTFPDIPQLSSAKLRANWPEWRTMAETIKAGRRLMDIDRNFTRRGMAAELLYAKGDEHSLLMQIDEEKNPGFRQRLEADFMARYDRLCDSVLYFPGDAVLLQMGTIHRFDALPK